MCPEKNKVMKLWLFNSNQKSIGIDCERAVPHLDWTSVSKMGVHGSCKQSALSGRPPVPPTTKSGHAWLDWLMRSTLSDPKKQLKITEIRVSMLNSSGSFLLIKGSLVKKLPSYRVLTPPHLTWLTSPISHHTPHTSHHSHLTSYMTHLASHITHITSHHSHHTSLTSHHITHITHHSHHLHHSHLTSLTSHNTRTTHLT